MTHVSLFTGIGGIDLAAEWAGFTTALQCEIDPACQAVLRKHWPDVPLAEDITRLTGAQVIEACGVRPTLITGGFPCQDISNANAAGKGIDGDRSGLWADMFRVINDSRPTWVVAENVANLRLRGSDRVLGDLERAGYTCWPTVVGSANAGAPHRRLRCFVVAYANPLTSEQADQAIDSFRERWPSLTCDPGRTGQVAPRSYWQTHQCPVPGMDDGVSGRVDGRVHIDRSGRMLGNAVNPWQVLPILRFIARWEGLTAPLLQRDPIACQ